MPSTTMTERIIDEVFGRFNISINKGDKDMLEERLLYPRYVRPSDGQAKENRSYIEAVRMGRGEVVCIDEVYYRISFINEAGVYGHAICVDCGDPLVKCYCRKAEQ